MIFFIIYAFIAAFNFWYLYKIQKKNTIELNEEYKHRDLTFKVSYLELSIEAILWPLFWLWIITLMVNNK